MNSLLTIENNYHHLLKKLSLSFCARYKVQLIFTFLEDALSKSIPVETYLLELITELENSVKNIHPKSINPAYFRKWLELTKLISSSISNQFILEKLIAISKEIHRKQTSLNELLASKNFDKPGRKSKKDSIAYIFETILKSQSIVNIPFVESEPLVQNTSNQFGIVCKLKIIITKISKKSEQDEVDIQLVSQKEKYQDYVKLIEYTKKLFQEITGKKITDKLSFHCSIELNNLISGNSLEAGFVTAIFIALYKMYDVRVTFDFPSNYSITGGLDEHGNLLEVDEEGLKLKLEACAFSEIKTLIVPKSQEQFCKDYLSGLELSTKYKLLEIKGIENIKEVYYDRRNLEQNISTVVQKVIKKTWNIRRPLAVSVIIILFLLLGKSIWGPLDRHPSWLEFSGQDIIVKNTFSEELKRIFAGKSAIDQMKNLSIHHDSLAVLSDVDNDGYQDVIYSFKNENVEDYELIKCFSIKKDSIIWEFKLKKDVKMNLYNLAEDKFYCWMLKVKNYQGNKKGVFILASTHYSPAMIYNINAKTGKETESYIHFGNLTSMKFKDLDKDNKEELIVTGTNQIFGTACLIVFDPSDIHGYGPVDKVHNFYEWPEANEKYYLSIPSTIVGKSFGDLPNYAMVGQLSFPGQRIKIDVRDTSIPSQYEPTFYLYFDYQLNPKAVSGGDSYFVRANEQFEKHLIKSIPDENYFRTYINEIIYLKKPQNY